MTDDSCKGPPVLLFPSLAGSVLECHKSPVEGFSGKNIWMSLSVLTAGRSDYSLNVQHSGSSSHIEQHPFVQHMVLDSDGNDIEGFKVRAKEGLAGCEYLSDQSMVKNGTVC